MTAPLLLRAAELLDHHADELKRSHTLPDGTWPETDDSDVQAQIDHNELCKVADALREKERGDIAFANSLSEALNTGDGSYRP